MPEGSASSPAGDRPKGELGRWQVKRLAGSARALHGRPWPATTDLEPAVTVLEVGGPAVVLGSTQAVSVVDGRAAAAAAVEVVRRRTGGGAVLLRPREVVWIDVEVPAGDARWSADVGRAFWWLGEAWVEALARLGVAEPTWHRGPLERNRWSSLACFAGLGPGEVRVGGAKVVGLCQRRTRVGALFQCAALLRWDPEALADLLLVRPGRRADLVAHLSQRATGLGLAAADVEDAFLAALSRR